METPPTPIGGTCKSAEMDMHLGAATAADSDASCAKTQDHQRPGLGLRHGVDCAEKAVTLITDARDEVERVGRSSACAIAEFESPEAGKRNGRAVLAELAQEFARGRVIGGDERLVGIVVVEVAYQDVVAEGAKVRRRR